MEAIKKFLSWLRRVWNSFVDLFKSEVKKKKKNIKSMTPIEVAKILATEGASFFVSGLKNRAQKNLQSDSTSAKLLRNLSLPYDECFEEDEIDARGTTFNLLSSLWHRAWYGTRKEIPLGISLSL